MKKIVYLLTIIMLIITGCSSNETNNIDTSEEIDQSINIGSYVGSDLNTFLDKFGYLLEEGQDQYGNIVYRGNGITAIPIDNIITYIDSENDEYDIYGIKLDMDFNEALSQVNKYCYDVKTEFENEFFDSTIEGHLVVNNYEAVISVIFNSRTEIAMAFIHIDNI